MYPSNLALSIREMFPDLTEGVDWSVENGDLVWSCELTKPTCAEVNGYNSYRQSQIKVEIESLEQTVTKRRIIEATLGIDNGWLNDTNEQIAELRGKL